MLAFLLLALLVPAARASCGGLSGDDLFGCEAGEREMYRVMAVRLGQLPAAGSLTQLFTRTLLTEEEIAAMADDATEICRRFPRRGWAVLRRGDRTRVWKVRCDGAGGTLGVAKPPPLPAASNP